MLPLLRRFLATNATQIWDQASPRAASVDRDELTKFSKVATRWWSGEEFRALRNLNQLRVPLIRDTFLMNNNNNNTIKTSSSSRLPLEGVRLLDIGCGGGILSEGLARLGAQVTAIDPVEESIEAAKAHAKLTLDSDQIPEYQCSTVESFATTQNKLHFDGIIASEVLEHVEDLKSFLTSSLHCLRPGGFYFITTINQSPVAYLTAILAAERLLGLLPRGTHEYRKLIPPAGLRLILKDHSCDVIQIHGMCLNPLNLRWAWSQNQLVNYAMVARKID